MLEKTVVVNPEKFVTFVKFLDKGITNEAIDKIYAIFRLEGIIDNDGRIHVDRIDWEREHDFYLKSILVKGTETKLQKEFTKISLKIMYEDSRDVFYEFVSDILNESSLTDLLNDLGIQDLKDINLENTYDVIEYLDKKKYLGSNSEEVVQLLIDYVDYRMLFNLLVVESNEWWYVCKGPMGNWVLIPLF